MALAAYNNGTSKWDNFGFKDSTYNSTVGYDTFKLALYILASKILNCPYNSTAYFELLSCQLTSGVSGSYDSGGFATYYFTNGTTNRQTNTETTALGVLALDNPPVIPTPSPTPTTTPEFQILPLEIAIVILLASTAVITFSLKRARLIKL